MQPLRLMVASENIKSNPNFMDRHHGLHCILYLFTLYFQHYNMFLAWKQIPSVIMPSIILQKVEFKVS